MGAIRRLLRRLHSVFNKDPQNVAVIQVRSTVPGVTLNLDNAAAVIVAPEQVEDGPNMLTNPSFATTPTTWAAPEPWIAVAG